VKIGREQYEEMCSDLFGQCIPPLIMAMQDAKITADEIDEIVLAGDFT